MSFLRRLSTGTVGRSKQTVDKFRKNSSGFNQIKLPLDVVIVSTDSDGFIDRDELRVDAVFNQSLRESLEAATPLMRKAEGEDPSAVGVSDMVCYEGMHRGKEIDLSDRPTDVEYISNCLNKDIIPMLFICNKESETRSNDALPITKRKQSVLIRRVLHAGSESVEQSTGSSVSIGAENSSSVSMKTASLATDELDDVITSHKEENEIDDVFPTVPHAPVKAMKSATVGRNLVASKSLLDFDESSNREPGLRILGRNGHLRGLMGDKEGRQRTTVSVESLPANEGFRQRSSVADNDKAMRMWEMRRRRGAMKRKSTLDLEYSTCSFKILTDVGEDDQSASAVVVCSNYVTVSELKHIARRKLEEQGRVLRSDGYGDRGAGMLTLLYLWQGRVYELYNESQILLDTALYKRLVDVENRDEEAIPAIIVKMSDKTSQKELAALNRISKLTNVLLDREMEDLDEFKTLTKIHPRDLPEVQSSRRSLHDLVVSIADERDNQLYALSPDVLTTAIPGMLTLKVPFTNCLPVTFHYFNDFSLTRQVNINYSAEAILSEIYPCLVACKLVSKSVDVYTLQITGEESYICGRVELIAFRNIRRCIAKNEHIHLSVVEKPSVDCHKRLDFDWTALDPNSNSQPLHCQVSSNFRNITESVWECNHPFKLKVVRGENLPFNSSGEVLIEMSLHLGAKIIHGAKRTEWVVQDSYTVAWNQELEFLTELKDIPKAAKLLIIVRQTRTKDADNEKRTFYWGLLTVFDHRGVLRTGDQLVYLWKAKLPRHDRKLSVVKTPIIEMKQTDYQEKLNSMLAGPVANNPSPDAARVVVNFENKGKPVYFPSTGEKSRQSLFKHHPAIRNVRIRRYFEKFYKISFMDRPTEKKLYHSLPRHLLLTNWSDFTERLELYNLLDTLRQEIDNIPLYVALQLLDSDFHDENIREFAVEVLERKLLDEDIEDYLLQLTQALKFEPFHDSPLARFLLKKALYNKRIGHSFFWCLKSEMHDAQYVPRFAVILEAYLKGCGEEMISNFIDQVHLQNSLEAVSEQLKGDFSKDGVRMQEALPGLLKEKGLTKFQFISPFSHRFKFGDLRLEKCKVMSSAKKPLWLEFVNVTQSSLKLSPIRLIYKTGDDLRQDVITLKMLTLFEKLWENEGLDLKLIPYGCLATSTNTGFIEVVKNAKTISEVSGISENQKKRLYEWIESHQLNEFGEIDQDKVKSAVNTFMRSCAGYSVATYTLGIGDRHNDNIMVTTSGNLFHIDFGHFLGNIKYFKGIRREWAPFVLTPDFVHVLGGEHSETFQTYKNLCCRAFLILRRHADLIISLFALMRSTGIPELACVDDIDYIRTALVLDETDSKAEGKFLDVIQQCLNLKWTVQLSWIAHNLRHKTSS